MDLPPEVDPRSAKAKFPLAKMYSISISFFPIRFDWPIGTEKQWNINIRSNEEAKKLTNLLPFLLHPKRVWAKLRRVRISVKSILREIFRQTRPQEG